MREDISRGEIEMLLDHRESKQKSFHGRKTLGDRKKGGCGGNTATELRYRLDHTVGIFQLFKLLDI